MKKLISVILLLCLTFSLTSCDVAKIVLGVFDLVKEDNTNIDLDFNFGSNHVHNEGTIPAIESTCTTHGKTEGKYCTICEKVLVEQIEAPLKEHTYDNSIDKDCNVCGYTREVGCYHINIDVLEAVESTCTSTGLTEGRQCKDCSEILVAQEPTALKNHTLTDWIIDKNPTADEEGEKHIECSVCKQVIEISTIPALTPASEGLEYTLSSDKKYYIVSGIGNCISPDVVIADTYNGLPVTQIANKAFENRGSIKSITIPKSIVKIGTSAFEGCSSIDDVYYLGGVEDWCKIKFSVNTNSNPLHYGANLYLNGALVVNLHIPDTVDEIPEFAFRGCASLKSVTMGNSIEAIPTSAFAHCSNLDKVVIGNFVTIIDDSAFSSCESLKEIVFSNSVKSIDSQAFRECTSLKTVTFPYSLKSISMYAFFGCSALETVYIPDSVNYIANNSFQNCTNITFYCEHEQAPEGFGDNWNRGCTVVWGYTFE